MSVRHKIHYYKEPYSCIDSIALCEENIVIHYTENKICVTCKECLKIIRGN